MSCEIAAQSNKNDCAMLDKNVLKVQLSTEGDRSRPLPRGRLAPKCTTPWHGHGVVLSKRGLPYVGQATHVGLQRRRDGDTAVFLLVVLDHRHQGAPYRQA